MTTSYFAAPSPYARHFAPWCVMCQTPDGVAAIMLFCQKQETAETIARVLNDDTGTR